MTTYTRIDEAAAAAHCLSQDLAEYRTVTSARIRELERQIEEANAAVRAAGAGLDLHKVALAETVLDIRGTYARGGEERAGVLRDAISEIATGKKIGLHGLWDAFFGTKSYDRWFGQRSDHEYGYGPKHGSIIFAIGLKPEVRRREPRELTADEREACVYYLTNLETIQAARAKVAA